MNRTDRIVCPKIMKTPCHLLRGFCPALFIHPFGRFPFFFRKDFIFGYTQTMDIRQLIEKVEKIVEKTSISQQFNVRIEYYIFIEKSMNQGLFFN